MSEQPQTEQQHFEGDPLQGVNHAQVEHLTKAFSLMADRLGGISNQTAMWALATLTSRVFALCAMEPEVQRLTGERFAAMLRMAYPITVQAMEHTERQRQGKPPFDA